MEKQFSTYDSPVWNEASEALAGLSDQQVNRVLPEHDSKASMADTGNGNFRGRASAMGFVNH